MGLPVSRRRFIAGLTSATVIVASPLKTVGRRAEEHALYPPEDLSYFDRPLRPAAGIRFGYHAITWEGDDQRAIKEIAELGFKGIQVRSNVLKDYGDRPAAFGELLRKHGLEFVALSSGGVSIAPGREQEEIEKHVKNAKFVRDAGGLYLQLTDSARTKGRAPVEQDFKLLGKALTEISKRAVDLGIAVGYHNHMNSLGESPAEVDRIMEYSDRRYVRFELDIAHYTQGGGNPVEAIRKHKDRLLFLHIKDVESPVRDDQTKSYRFVELGRGKVDLAGVFKALKEVGFSGWAVIELDSVTEKSRSAKESAAISKRYIEEKIGLRI